MKATRMRPREIDSTKGHQSSHVMCVDASRAHEGS